MGLNLTSSPIVLREKVGSLAGLQVAPGAIASGPCPPSVVFRVPISQKENLEAQESLPGGTSWPLAPAVMGGFPREAAGRGGGCEVGPSQSKSCPPSSPLRWASPGPPGTRSLTLSCLALWPPPTVPQLASSLALRTRTWCPL